MIHHLPPPSAGGGRVVVLIGFVTLHTDVAYPLADLGHGGTVLHSSRVQAWILWTPWNV
jgi:hypothetical protein